MNFNDTFDANEVNSSFPPPAEAGSPTLHPGTSTNPPVFSCFFTSFFGTPFFGRGTIILVFLFLPIFNLGMENGYVS